MLEDAPGPMLVVADDGNGENHDLFVHADTAENAVKAMELYYECDRADSDHIVVWDIRAMIGAGPDINNALPWDTAFRTVIK
jgi:hypothetical protein